MLRIIYIQHREISLGPSTLSHPLPVPPILYNSHDSLPTDKHSPPTTNHPLFSIPQYIPNVYRSEETTPNATFDA
jgi:hypothetical protein